MATALLLSCLLLGAAPSQAPDPDLKGPFEVGFTHYLLNDTSRPGDAFGVYAHRPIPVYVWYPADARAIGPGAQQAAYPLDPLYLGEPVGGIPDALSSDLEPHGVDRAYQDPPVSALRPFPVLVFSPGWGIPAWMHASIGARLASHGFVVAVPYHAGDQWWGWEPPFDTLSVAAFNRPRDASFVLTDLLQKNVAPGHPLRGAVRPGEVAAGGWSLGGYAAMVLAGGDDDVCDTPFGDLDAQIGRGPCALPAGTRSSPDPRFKAIVPLDGSSQVLHFAELARVTVPSMGMGEEWSTLASDPVFASWQARHHAAFSGHPNYRADVWNSNHQSFSDLCDDNQMLGVVAPPIWPPEVVAFFADLLCTGVTPPAEVHRLVNKYLVAFLKTNLAREPGYQHVLTPGYALTREPLIEFFVTEKRSPSAIREDWPSDFLYFPHQPGSAQMRAAKDPVAGKAVQRALQPK
jgi:hypothetical protein